jgi:hypothetical protein
MSLKLNICEMHLLLNFQVSVYTLAVECSSWINVCDVEVPQLSLSCLSAVSIGFLDAWSSLMTDWTIGHVNLFIMFIDCDISETGACVYLLDFRCAICESVDNWVSLSHNTRVANFASSWLNSKSSRVCCTQGKCVQISAECGHSSSNDSGQESWWANRGD